MTSLALAVDQSTAADASRLNNIGVALMNQQLTEKALAKFEAAHTADPSAVVPVVNKGIALLYLQKIPDAEEALKQAAAADPNNARTWYALGLTHLNGGNPKLAIDDLQHVVKIDPNDADAHYFMGSFYLSLNDYAHAKQEYEAALTLNPIHASAHFGLARALQRMGDVSASREHLKRFQELTENKISSPLSAAYGEQGRYATVENMLAPPVKPGPMIPVTLVAEAITGPISPAPESTSVPRGSGACLFDINSSSSKELILLGSGERAIRIYEIDASGKFTETPAAPMGLRTSGQAIACAVGDYDSDGLPDLAIAFSDRVALFHNLGKGRFEDVTKAVGIQQLNKPAGVLFLDFDHDGDVDLFVTGAATNSAAGPSVLWRNNGNSTFTEWTGLTGLSGKESTAGATLSDINNDRAIDLVVTGADSSPAIYLNQREGKFKPMSLYSDATLSPTRGAAVFDFNKDGWMDIAVTHAGAPGISLWRNVDGKAFERVPLPIKDATAAWGLTAIDIDNDGWIDLAAIVQSSTGPGLRIFRNRGPEGFEDVSAAVGATKLNLSNPRTLIAADVDGDGAADLIVTEADGSATVLKNVGGNKNHSLRIALTGLADNKTAIGTKVEVFANGQEQKFEATGGAGYLSQGPTDILAGLGQTEQVDVVRMLWPTGVPQDEIDISAAKPLALKELDRRGSSCPVLFAWDGKKYQFISDVIGAAVVGHWVSPAATNQADPDEWIKVDGSQLKPRNGYLSLRFGELMEEINFVDQLRLVAIDHPENTDAYPDERFLSEPPFASGKAVVASAKTRPVAGAWDDRGHDVLALIAKRDHQYVRDFDNLSYAGYANMHTLTLDVGKWTPDNPIRLFMHGFIEYFSASSMYAAWQAGLEPIPPYVEAQMPDGSWKRIVDDMGFPAGLPRTIVVDLTGKLPAGATKIRIATNLQIYWDQVLVDNGPENAMQTRETELPLSVAHLAFRGYPQQIDGATPGDLHYDYEKISETGPFQWQRGPYTHYGNVTQLLDKPDNKYVIFGSGEEIDAEFSAETLPALPAHWKRDYFFYANGFVKDMDFYEILPFTVAQMPFHEESTYPYPATEHYPENADTLQYLLNWDERFETGNRSQRFQFDYKPTVSQPITEP
ncbi:FG-GAP-like repeat-containing protein [Silvibacterium bohemicum]|uniref:FG-GAP-like repeat-containing protein n=1 Tax=Silvibacterium bohemicum TaxID=1577686 RepID=UPI0009E5E181|nr:FG-GAP-like repeat-containing protein [Silvibacterium bohemicum]